jgi:basic amino acid/polyamine antiporter, APA family
VQETVGFFATLRMTSGNTQDGGLKRVIGIPSLAASVVNFSIGAAIYALPALIGIELGSGAIVGLTLYALMFATIILCYAEVGSKIKTSGGSYAYVQAAFGPFAGFIVNWLFFLGWGIVSDAAIVNVIADSLSQMFPVLKDSTLRMVLILSMVAFMIWMNILSTKVSVRFLNVITTIKLIPLLAIIVFGIAYVDTDLLRIERLPSAKSLNDTAILLFFFFAGFESALGVSGEIKNPERTIPRAVLIGGIIVFLVYVLMQTVVQGILGAQLEQFKTAPLSAIGEKLAGHIAAVLILVAAAVSGFGAVHADVLASSRLLFAGAKDGLFPKFLGRVHKKFQTPHLAVTVFGALIFAFAISGGFKKLAVLASGALLLIYLAVVLATIKLRMKKDANAAGSFKVRGGLLIPVIAIAAILYTLSNLAKDEIISIGVFVGVICGIYFVMMALRKKQVNT